MPGSTQSRRVVAVIALAGGLIAAVCLGSVYVHCKSVQYPKTGGIIEEWLTVGFALRELDRAESFNAITEDEYDAEERRLLLRVRQIAYADEFPRNMEELNAYKNAHARSASLPFVFWLACATAGMTCIAAMSWLLSNSRSNQQVTDGTTIGQSASH